MAGKPEIIDKYGEVSLVARGGMGAVYKGLHPTLKRPVILKKLTLRGKASFSERFKREARILMDFRHDDIVTVFDHFKQGSSYFIVMEFVDGMSLEELVKEFRYLDPLITAYILLHAARALEYAHDRGVIHRDIKPANILLSRDGTIKLADFGIASSSDDADSGLTSEGMTLGTPSYMAPEQFRNSKNVDAQADIYALGVMTYEMLTGKQPFTGGFCPELIHAKQRGIYRNPRRYVPEIRRPLLRILRKCMRASKKRRMRSARLLIIRLEKYLKPYDHDSLKELLASMVRRDEVQPGIKKRKNILRKVLVAATAVVGTALIVAAFFFSTLLHPLFVGNTHGRFRLAALIPPAEAACGGSPEAVLFLDDAADIPEIGRIRLFPDLFNRDDDGESFMSLPMFLPTGQYRVKIIFGQDVYWAAFFLPSYRQQLKDGFLRQHMETVNLPEIAAGRVDVEIHVCDAVTGRSLDDEADIRIASGKGFSAFHNDTEVLSGAVRTFLIKAPGYTAQEYSLFLKPRDRNLRISAALVPLPAEIRIKGDVEGLDLLINDSRWFDSYEKDPGGGECKIISVDTANIDPADFTIVPGQYRLEGRRHGMAGRINIGLAAGEAVELTVSEEEGSLVFNRE